jgi:3-oxoadipate enol-lactonase
MHTETMHIDDVGTGEPVVLAHAGVTDRHIWDRLVPVLRAANYRVIRYDAPGYGLSPRPTGPHSLVGDALAVFEATGVESAHWIGLSQGGATGVDLAIAHPHLIRSLALIAPGMSGYDWPELPGTQRRRAVAASGDKQAMGLEVLRLWGPLSFDEHGELRANDPAAKTLLDQIDWLASDEDEEIEEPPSEPRLGEVDVPTLIVLGDSDIPEITDIGHRYAHGIRGSRLVMLSEADHLLPLRRPDRLHPLLLEHLDSASGTELRPAAGPAE